MDEIAALTPSYGGLSFARLEQGGLCWPCPSADHPGTPILHVDKFTRGKGRFFAVAYQPPAEEADAAYPLTLTTGRLLEHYHTGTMTRRSDGLNELVPTGFAEVNPADAKQLGVVDGATYTDVKAQLPALNLLMFIAVIGAALDDSGPGVSAD